MKENFNNNNNDSNSVVVIQIIIVIIYNDFEKEPFSQSKYNSFIKRVFILFENG